jgi:hypothetical protein
MLYLICTAFRTNLPKELMNYPNFPYKGLDNVSFLTPFQVQEYIEQFTKHFKLTQHIRVSIDFNNICRADLRYDRCATAQGAKIRTAREKR